MERFSDNQVSGKVLDHLGLVAATIDKLGLIEKIDSRLPVSKEKGAKVSMGQRVAAMILNGLGFMDNRLYMFPEFLENKPVDRLLGDGLKAEDFNDDALGRCLDAIHDYGTTELFSDLAFSIGVEQNLLGCSANIDSSTLSVYGDYAEQTQDDGVVMPASANDNNVATANDEPEETESLVPKTPTVTHGYSKDHRPDLKQVVINLATTGAAGFPIWFECHSGNASDKKILLGAAERMQGLCDQLKDSPSFLYVADSAMYESCVNNAGDMPWLSRVPEHLKVAKKLVQQADEDFVWTELGKGYRICTIENRYKGIHQRWCIVSSEQAYKRETKTLDKNISKMEEKAKKELWHLSCQTYGCEKDAEKALVRFEKSLKFHSVVGEIQTITKHKGKGRPKKGDIAEVVGYKIQGELSKSSEKIDPVRRQKGRFILATNRLDRGLLPDTKILPEYKQQSKTENGFRFIKDDTFEVSSIYLKKPSRISALMMIMTLCLMVYSVAQYHLRQRLANADEDIPDQRKKPTRTPTMKRVFKLFNGVQVLTIKTDEHAQELVINLSNLLKRVVLYFGPRAQQIYGVSG